MGMNRLFDAAADTDSGSDCAKKLVCFIMSKEPESRTISESGVAGLFDGSTVEASSTGGGFRSFHAAAVIGGLGRNDLCEYAYPRLAKIQSDLTKPFLQPDCINRDYFTKPLNFQVSDGGEPTLCNPERGPSMIKW